MSIASATKIEQISRAADPKKAILAALGDLTGAEVFDDLVLVATFIRNEKTKAGLYLPTEHLKEDEYQGKVALVVKTGPLAYGEWESDRDKGQKAAIGSWIVAAIKDGWPVQINGVACRFIPYEKIRMRVSDPTMVF
jgi:co-chaperonin GroES (HSP10)